MVSAARLTHGRGPADLDAANGRVTAYVLQAPELRLWGLSPAERLRRSLQRAGVDSVRGEHDPWPEDGRVLLLRGDYVYDDAVIAGLAAADPGVLLELPNNADGGHGRIVAAHVAADAAAGAAERLRGAPGGDEVNGLRHLRPADVAATHNQGLRKRAEPYVLPLSRESLPAVERRMFAGAYKGVTDLVTKWLWPAPARWATRQAARLGMHPNVVTAAAFVLTVLAFYWFLEGRLGLGLVAAWLMTFLDTVDGKLARLTLTSSKFGNAFDHGIDLLHPPFWYVAWGLGLSAAGSPPPPGGLVPVLIVVVGGYIVGRLIEGFFIWRYGIEIHTWRPVDSAFRLVTARRNPNLILLTAATLLGRPDLGLAAVALWTALSILFHLARIGQALAAAGWRGRLTSWLAESAGASSP